MPVLKAPVLVEFDPENPYHLSCLLEVEQGTRRTSPVSFNYSHPFQSWVAEARWKCSMAHIRRASRMFPKYFGGEEVAPANVYPLAVAGGIGAKSKALPDVHPRILTNPSRRPLEELKEK